MTASRWNALARLRRQRRAAFRRLSTHGQMIKASLVVNRRRCGKPGCRCTQGELHESLAFTYKQDGKSVLVHIPQHLEAEARQAQHDYRKLKTLIAELSAINIKLLKHKAQRSKSRQR